MKAWRVFGLVGYVLLRLVDGCRGSSVNDEAASLPLPGDLTLIKSGFDKGAVCLDGSLPGYHLHRGNGSGTHSWFVFLQGGGWCNDISSCVERSKNEFGSSKYMEKQFDFTEILSEKPEQNPDFFNWNRVVIRYCDGGSFSGEGYDEATGLFFRGQRIWMATMEELMSQGMHNAKEAILSGCSSGGQSVIIHCDQFRKLFPGNIKVKCLADAALFLDALDVAGNRTMRSIYSGVVTLQGMEKNLPVKCTDRMDTTSCFFPQNLVAHVETPLFLLNAAYDFWQLRNSLSTAIADPLGHWLRCRNNYENCNPEQLQFLQGFRRQMLENISDFSTQSKNGLFINSCFSHCQSSGGIDTWFNNHSPMISNKTIAESFSDWYFDRSEVKLVGCPYPCDKTCHHITIDDGLANSFSDLKVALFGRSEVKPIA